jgi:hypothetical protein
MTGDPLGGRWSGTRHAGPAATSGTIAGAAAEEPASTAAALGTTWLLRSGIQDANGGCHAWYDVIRRHYEFYYPEVTGYVVTLHEWLAGLDARTDPAARDRHRAAASRASAWLSELSIGGDGFPCLVADEGVRDGGTAATPATSQAFRRKAQRHYTFDAGIVLQGLVAYGQRTGDEDVLKTARILGDWLLTLQHQDGTFTPFTGPDAWQDVPGDWSTRPGVHQAKIAIGLLALTEAADDGRYRDAAVLASKAATDRQGEDGRYRTNDATGGTNIHPHCYAAEACWVVGTATGDETLLDSARRGTRWLLDTSPPAQVLRVWHPQYGVNPHMRIDGLAQLLRLGILTGTASDAELAALEQTLIGYQDRSDDEQIRGGFRFGHTSSGDDLPHANVWVTSFAVQALTLLARHRAGEQPLDWRYMV